VGKVSTIDFRTYKKRQGSHFIIIYRLNSKGDSKEVDYMRTFPDRRMLKYRDLSYERIPVLIMFRIVLMLRWNAFLESQDGGNISGRLLDTPG